MSDGVGQTALCLTAANAGPARQHVAYSCFCGLHAPAQLTVDEAPVAVCVSGLVVRIPAGSRGAHRSSQGACALPMWNNACCRAPASSHRLLHKQAPACTSCCASSRDVVAARGGVADADVANCGLTDHVCSGVGAGGGAGWVHKKRPQHIADRVCAAAAEPVSRTARAKSASFQQQAHS